MENRGENECEYAQKCTVVHRTDGQRYSAEETSRWWYSYVPAFHKSYPTCNFPEPGASLRKIKKVLPKSNINIAEKRNSFKHKTEPTGCV